MRLIFCTQSESLPVFDAMRRRMAELGRCESAAFIVSDRWSYTRYLRQHPHFEESSQALLKEWEVTAIRDAPPDRKWLAAAEQRLGADAGLFGALVADRRIWMGPSCTFTQDYRRRFSDDELLSVLRAGVERVEALFDKVQPQALVGFICVTFLDYIAYLVARSRGIAVLNLRPTRVSDRVNFSTRLNDPAPEFLAMIDQINKTAPFAEAARQHIDRVRRTHGRYEGVVGPSDKPALQVNRLRRSLFSALYGALANYKDYRVNGGHTDNHVVNPVRLLLHSVLINPLRAWVARRKLDPHYVRARDLPDLCYAFFPLHTEPEVSLLVYGRPYVNQIEVIRSLAMNLPADRILLVKEHPWMVGKRSMDYYNALLNIPRVRLVQPSVDARDLILNADLVTVITGSIALEATILGKPVLTFGDCPYNALPPSMVQRVTDPRVLSLQIRNLLESQAPNDVALEAYVAATLAISESIHLYSTLLGKANVYAERGTIFDEEIAKLAEYAIRFYDEVAEPAAKASPAGVW